MVSKKAKMKKIFLKYIKNRGNFKKSNKLYPLKENAE